MKVLKEGKGNWSREETCTGKGNGDGGCGAVLLLEEGDFFYTYSHIKDETDRFISFRCPCCSVLTDVKNIPSRISIRGKE